MPSLSELKSFMERLMQVEVVYGDAEHQTLLNCEIAESSTVRDAIIHSGILQKYPELEISSLELGVFSKKVDLTHDLQEGDRVEIYRPLTIDPKEARRLRAKM